MRIEMLQNYLSGNITALLFWNILAGLKNYETKIIILPLPCGTIFEYLSIPNIRISL